MGDTTVDFFQETLKQLITSSKLRLTIDEKRQLQSLQEEIKYLRGFLKDTEKKRNEHLELMKLVMQIRDVVFEAEIIIDLFVDRDFKRLVDCDFKRPTSYQYLLFLVNNAYQYLRQLLKVDHPSLDLDHPSLDLKSVEKEIKTLMAKVKQIYDMKMYDINGVAVKIPKHSSTRSEVGGSGSSGGSNSSKLVKENVVKGFKEEVIRVIEKLDDRGEGRPLEIITIIGAGGGGKTTLAREVYDNRFTSYIFEIRAWVDVSQDYNKTMKRNLLIRILKLASLGKEADYEERSDDELGEDVHKCLKGRKYLIVMDDIWGIEAWNDMQRSFPKECKGSKVLFTSRLNNVQPDNISHVPYYLDPLTKNLSWELLQKKVFGMKCCPPELVDIGEQIAQKCDGLPLAIVTIAGLLKKKDKTLKEWVEVAEHLSSIIAKNQEGCMEILELSYNPLPLHLKACFLYIGGFEDREIPVRNLIWLWIAEGFIQQSEGKSMEAMAKDYLLDLIDRSLIIVARKNPLGIIKTCRIHDLLRELCLKKAEEDNFLVKIYEDDSFQTFASNNHCRLFIGSKFFAGEHFLGFTRKSHHAQKVRTFFWSKSSMWSWNIMHYFRRNYLESFKHLRVLSYISYGSLEVGIHPVHLRYLQLDHSMPKSGRSWIEAPFSHHLETINFELRMQTSQLSTKKRTMQLPYDIFKMVKLRHLYSQRSKFAYHCCLHRPPSSEETARIDFDHSSKLGSLQTLHSICACKVCLSFLVRTPNLRKLGILGNLISEDGVLMIPDLEFLKSLETLSLKNDFRYMAGINTLPKVLKLPPTITQLTLCFTRLNWEELSILQTALPSLEVLKLKMGCVGPVWKTSEDGFSQLKYLKLDDLDIEEWNASEDQFPKLEVLVLHSCIELEQIPMDFANLNELREIEVAWCTSLAEKSAREIQEEQINKKGDDFLNLRLQENRFPPTYSRKRREYFFDHWNGLSEFIESSRSA